MRAGSLIPLLLVIVVVAASQIAGIPAGAVKYNKEYYSHTRYDAKYVFIIRDFNGRIIGMEPDIIRVVNDNVETLEVIDAGVNITGYREISRDMYWSPSPPVEEVYIPSLDARVLLFVNTVPYDQVDTGYKLGNKTMKDFVFTGGSSIITDIKILSIGNLSGLDPYKPLPIGQLIQSSLPSSYSYTVKIRYAIYKAYREGNQTVERPCCYADIYDVNSLDLSPVKVNVSIVDVNLSSIELEGMDSYGNLSTGVVFYPAYRVTVCGRIHGLSGTGPVSVRLADKTFDLLLRNQAPTCKTQGGVHLAPGRNVTIRGTVITSAVTGNFNYTTSIPGEQISIARPVGSAVRLGNDSDWNITIYVPIIIRGYFEEWPTLTVTGEASGNNVSLKCNTLQIASNGTYRLKCKGSAPGYYSSNRVAGPYHLVLKLYGIGDREYRVSGDVKVVTVSGSSVADMAIHVYNMAVSLLSYGLVAAIFLEVFSMLYMYITGHELVDTRFQMNVIMTFLASLVIMEVGIPLIYAAFEGVLANIPIFSQYISLPHSYNPTVVLHSTFAYYDALFNKIQADYTSVFQQGVSEIIGAVRNVIIVGLGFLVVALAVSFLPGAAIAPGSLASSIFGIVFSVIGLIVMVVPGAAIILVSLAIGKIIVIITVVIMIIVFLLGVLMLLVPSGISQRYAETLVGAGLIFFIVSPLIGPISYAFYSYVIEMALSLKGSLSIPVLGAFIPLDAFVLIMMYLFASGTALLIVILTLTYVISRTGIASGLGEAFATLVWR